METEKQVIIKGDASGTVIITGEGNQVSLTAQGEFAFHPLDDTFRAQQRQRAPADFYDGTRPNWSNIALQHDSPRRLLENLLKFVSDPSLPPQRIGIITGLSGEGKTTLLMRAAWKLAESGPPVLWRHNGHVQRSYSLSPSGEQQPIICFDEIAYEEELPKLVSYLAESGVPFILLGSARRHDWENCEMRSALGRNAKLQEFPLERLDGDEVRDLLKCLDRANALGVLASLPHDQRLSHFLDRLKADGQLLPALLTARRGQSFEQILESVFEGLSKRHGRETADFLLRGYAGIALVHRFNFWMTRPLLAVFIGMTEDQIAYRLLRPLQGELLEISAGDETQLSTRHPWIAEEALRLLVRRYVLPEEKIPVSKPV